MLHGTLKTKKKAYLHSLLFKSGDKSSNIIRFDFYFYQERFSKGPHLHSCHIVTAVLRHSLFVLISIDSPSFLSFISLSLSLPLFSSAAFGVTPPGGFAGGLPTALLSGAFAAVSLQLSACDKES